MCCESFVFGRSRRYALGGTGGGHRTPVLVEAASGELAAVGTMPWYVSALLDVIAIVVLGSGVYLWVRKRRVSVQERLAALGRLQSDEDDLPLHARQEARA